MLDRNNRVTQALLLLPLVFLYLALFQKPFGFLLKGLFGLCFMEEIRQLKPLVIMTAFEL
jgi:hypothetical protein